MKVGPFQTLCLIDGDQLRGKILTMPDGDLSEYYLVEITEEKKSGKSDNLGCQVIVSKDKVLKYTKKYEGEKSEQQVIFDQYDVIAQYKNRDDDKVFKFNGYFENLDAELGLKDKSEVSAEKKDG